MRSTHLATSLAISLLLITAGPGSALAAKIAVVPLRAGAGADAAMASSLGDVVVSEVRRTGRAEVITASEIAAILGHEKEKMLLGCDDAGCFAELGGALGADELLSGSVAKLGTSWLLHLKRIDVGSVKVVAQVDRRLKGGTIDDMLDVLPAMTKELIAAAPFAAGKVATARAAAAPSGQVGNAELPSPTQEIPAKAEETAGLVLHTDGKGRYLAHNPEKAQRSPIFFGDAKRMFKQWVQSKGSRGRGTYDVTVWDPRYLDGYKRQFNHDSKLTKRRCGDEITELKPVPPTKAKKILATAKLFEPLWSRGAIFIAMDPGARYYLIDRSKVPRTATDFRLFIGPKGGMRYVEVIDSALKSGGETYMTGVGRLEVSYDRGKRVAFWITGAQKTELTILPLFDKAKMIYTELGVYDGKRLGTLCDPL